MKSTEEACLVRKGSINTTPYRREFSVQEVKVEDGVQIARAAVESWSGLTLAFSYKIMSASSGYE